MGGDGLCLARLADHEELGQDGHRLQVDGERPQDLGERTRADLVKYGRLHIDREPFDFMDVLY